MLILCAALRVCTLVVHNVQDGVTPLMYAVKQGDYKMTRILIEDGRANAKIAENVSIIATVEPPIKCSETV